MPTITQNVAVVIFLFVLILALIVGSLTNPETFDKSSTHSVLSSLAGLSIFVVFIFYYNVIILQKQQQQLAVIQETGHVNTSLIDGIQVKISEAAILVPQFAFSLTPLLNVDQYETIPDTCTPEGIMTTGILSNRIFTLWENQIISGSFLAKEAIPTITRFLQFANSGPLYWKWQQDKYNYNPATQQLGDLLFFYGLPIEDQQGIEYENVARTMVADPRFSMIDFNK